MIFGTITDVISIAELFPHIHHPSALMLQSLKVSLDRISSHSAHLCDHVTQLFDFFWLLFLIWWLLS